MKRPLWLRAATLLALSGTAHGVLLAAAPVAFADAPSTSLVVRGRSLFDDQQYEESIQTLSAALLRPTASKADKIEVYRLLAYNYITLGRKDEAEAAVRGLYALDPDFALPKGESPRFRDFFADVHKRWEAEGKPGLVADAAAPPPVKLTHASPAEAQHDEEIVLTGTIDDPQSRVVSVQLEYRSGSKGKFTAAPVTYSGGQFRATIPPSAAQPPLVEYYIEALDKGKLPVVSRGDAATPLRIAVQAPASGSVFASPWFWTGAGAVVAGGVLAGLLLTKKSDNGGAASSMSHVSVVVGE